MLTDTTTLNWQLATATVLPYGSMSRRQFWFAETGPCATRNVHAVYPPVDKLGVVLPATEPWEDDNATTFCGSMVRLDDGRLRLYYTTYPQGFGRMSLAIAESADGLTWSKPALGQVVIDGQDTNRIAFENFPTEQRQLTQPQVLRLPDGRWRMYFWHFTTGYRYTVAESEDGLRWRVPDGMPFVMVDSGMGGFGGDWALKDGQLPPEALQHDPAQVAEWWRQKGMRTNDACFIYINPVTGLYEYYAQWMLNPPPERRVAEDNVPHMNRVIQRRTSVDGLAWSVPELIVLPDARDPWDQQFYHLAVQWHEGWMLGSLGHYRVENGQQTQELELIFSRDGHTWQRPLRGGLIPRGAEGELDSMGIYPSNAWIDAGDHWLALYNGMPARHNEIEKSTVSPVVNVMAARWPKTRMLGWQAGAVTGGFLSDVFVLQGDAILLDADIRGVLRAELCDAYGHKLPGFHLMDSLPTTGNSRAHLLRWRNEDTARYRQDTLRLRVEYTDGTVYSLGF